MNIIEEVRALHLPVHEYIVFGSGTLGALGIREVGADIDLLVTPRLFDELIAHGWTRQEIDIEGRTRVRVTQGITESYKDLWYGDTDIDVPALIARPLMVEGIPFLPLDEVITMKRAFNRPKDLHDIALIEQYMLAHAH